MAIVDLMPNNLNPKSTNGYTGGAYNVLVTAFDPDNDYLKRYRNNDDNKLIYKKGDSQRGSGGISPSLLNENPFYIDNVSQPAPEVNTEDTRRSKKEDQDYLDAVTRGDMVTASKMVRER